MTSEHKRWSLGKMRFIDWFILVVVIVWGFLAVYGKARDAGFLSDFFGYPVVVEECVDAD